MQEIRVLFTPLAGNGYRARSPMATATASASRRVQPFSQRKDFEDLRWYLEEYMDLPDGGAVVRAQRIETNLAKWGRRLHDALFSATENR